MIVSCRIHFDALIIIAELSGFNPRRQPMLRNLVVALAATAAVVVGGNAGAASMSAPAAMRTAADSLKMTENVQFFWGDPSYSTRYRKAKASKGLTGSFGDRSWPRKAIIWAELAATKILRSVWRPRANSERARRPWFLMGMGCKRAIATPVLTVSATAKASSASKVQSLSGSVRCVASSAKPLVLRLPNMVSMVQR